MSGARQIPRPDAMAWTDSNASAKEGRAAVGRARWWRKSSPQSSGAQALQRGGDVSASDGRCPSSARRRRSVARSAWRGRAEIGGLVVGATPAWRRAVDDDSRHVARAPRLAASDGRDASWLAPATTRLAAIATAAAATANAISRVAAAGSSATADRAAGRVGDAGARAGSRGARGGALARPSADQEASASCVGVGRASIRARRASSSRSIVKSSAALVGRRERSIGLGGEVRQRREPWVVAIGVGVGARTGHHAAALARLAIEQQPTFLKVACR